MRSATRHGGEQAEAISIAKRRVEITPGVVDHDDYHIVRPEAGAGDHFPHRKAAVSLDLEAGSPACQVRESASHRGKIGVQSDLDHGPESLAWWRRSPDWRGVSFRRGIGILPATDTPFPARMGAIATEAPSMVFPDDSLLSGDHCEICGAELSAEVIIQEFADGSIARLCAECAAGASLESEGDELSGSAVAAASELDPMERTRELLTPVVDLMTLQREMQAALQRLAASLETFAAGVISENLDKTATVESRLETVEHELEQTRARLRETEALLIAAGGTVAAGQPEAEPEQTGAIAAAVAIGGAAASGVAAASRDAAATGSASDVAVVPGVAALGTTSGETQWPELPGEMVAAASEDEAWDLDATAEAVPAEAFLAAAIPAAFPPAEPVEAAESPGTPEAQPTAADAEAAIAAAASVGADTQSTLPPATPPLVPPPVAPPTGQPHARPGFQLPEVQLAQRYFNESTFTARIRDVRRSLGKPKANLTKLVGAEPRALLTIIWDIIWYQYLVDLRRDAPVDERVTLHREGMDLEELPAMFKEKNASVDDEGRLDASELEVKLLSDPSTLITEMSPDEERVLEDATEEIWDQKTAPEFKWDD